MYNKLTDKEKKEIIKKLYTDNLKSFGDIANQLDTYANKIRRDAKKFGIPIRDKSEAQRNALNNGKVAHPTKGKTRSETTKSKIGLSLAKSWDSMDDDARKTIVDKKKEQWNKMSQDQKDNMQKAANNAVRLAGKTGSKLEKYIFNNLLKNGWKVEFHKEQVLLDTKLQIDLLLPSINTAIEIDGPSHFVPVWGDDALKKNIKYDQKKQGLLIGKGYVLIRIVQEHDFSVTRARIVYEKLANTISTIVNKFPEPDNRIIFIKDTI